MYLLWKACWNALSNIILTWTSVCLVTEFDHILNFLTFSHYSSEQAWLIEGFTKWQKKNNVKEKLQDLQDQTGTTLNVQPQK